MPRAVAIPTARPTFDVDTAQERVDVARRLLTELGADVIGPETLVTTPEDIEAAAAHIDPDADLIVNVCGSFSDATPALRLYSQLSRPVLLWAFREPGPVGDRLRLNSLCGANLFAHALVRSGGEARLLYGDPDEPHIREALERALHGELPPATPLPSGQHERGDRATAQAALASLRQKRIGVIGDPPPGFTPCEYDADLVADLFGMHIEPLTVPEVFAKVRTVEPDARETERTDACRSQPSLAALAAAEVEQAAAVTTALRAWSDHRSLSAVAVRCWPEFPTELGVCPCFSLGRLADEGTPTTCERDVYGAITMLLLQALGSGTTYLVDAVDLDAEANVMRFWHCGSAATKLAADPADATQDVHCNRRIGVAGNFPLRPGRIVISRLCEDPDPSNPTGLRLLIAAGESLPAPNRFQGNTADVRLDSPADQFMHALVSGGFPHHTVLAWSDVRPELRSAADQLGVPIVEW